MNHVLCSVQQLYDDARFLYENCIDGNENFSADSILNDLDGCIRDLKLNWRGVDAGVGIAWIVDVFNQLVEIRNALLQLVEQTTKVAAKYREIQQLNDSSLESLSIIKGLVSNKLDEYSDNRDTVYINESAMNSQKVLQNSQSNLSKFYENIELKYNSIMNNWQYGPGRTSAEEAFKDFSGKVATYLEKLSNASSRISTSFQSYGTGLGGKNITNKTMNVSK